MNELDKVQKLRANLTSLERSDPPNRQKDIEKVGAKGQFIVRFFAK